MTGRLATDISRPHRFRVLAILATLVAGPATVAGAVPTTLWVNLEGHALDELAVEVGGEPITPTEGGDAGERWEIAVYVDLELSSPRAVRQAAEILIAQLDPLLSLGEIGVVRADPTPHATTRIGQDRTLLENDLYGLLYRARPRDRLRRLRTDFLEEQEIGAADSLSFLRAELDLRRTQQDALLTWIAAAGPAARPRLLLLVSDVLSVDSASFYFGADTESPESGLEVPELEDLAAVATTHGWAVATFSPPAKGPSDRFTFHPDEDLPVGIRLGRGGTSEESSSETPSVAPDDEIGLGRPHTSELEQLAADTGGRVLDSEQSLGRLLEQASLRRGLRLPLPNELLGSALAVAITTSGGRALDAQGLTGFGSPTALAGARARRFLAGIESADALPLSFVVEATPGAPGSAPILVVSEFSDATTPPLAVRVTTAVQLTDGRLLLRSIAVAEPTVEAEGEWGHRGQVELPQDTEAVAVVVERLDTGAWGATFARFVDSIEAASAERTISADADRTGTTRLVRLLPPRGSTLKGRLEIRAEAEPEVTRVRFRLDGEMVADRTERPFEAQVRLGRRATRHIIEAIAFDPDGRELDRDFLILNAPATSSWVRILEPRSGERVGPVNVEAEVRAPAGARVQRVDFFWNDRLVATSREEPHRRTILVPFSQPSGFIRVQATLTDGTTVDDLVLMNSARFGSAVDVELVELLVVVTNDDGDPVSGLARGQFTVLEGGESQKIVDFAAAGDLPITVGLAIDSSSSLFKRFADVQRSSTAFVESLEPGRDRALLVGFGKEPRLVREVTGDLDEVSAGISELQTAGRTAVWEGIVRALLELESVPGRRALVVFYDGDDEDEKSSYQTAVGLAERLGIPVYLIVMNNEAAKSEGRDFRTRSFTRRLDRLAGAGGGRVFYVRTNADLTGIFDLIGDELRSHYLITYYPRDGSSDRRWRSVEIEMERSDLQARTVSGYEAGPAR